MASKEATVYIIDVGSTMREKNHGRTQSNLDWALEYFWDKLTATIATGRKTAMAGVVAFRTDETQNPLADEDSYQHVSILQNLSQVLMPDVRRLRGDLRPSSTFQGDAIDALVVAIHMITETCKKLQYLRKIILLTDARAPMDTDDLSEIRKKLAEDKIDLVVLGVDFDDAEYGFSEENKDASKEENEACLKQLTDDCNGTYGTLAEAIDETQKPRMKTVRPTPSYKGCLTLGNPEKYADALTINVERYPKTMKATPPSSSQFTVRNGTQIPSQTVADPSEGTNQGADGEGLSAVRMARTYQVNDENAPGGKKDIERDELARGYEYGRTAVHISESDRNVTNFETKAGLDIVGFVDRKQYQHYLDLSRANMIVCKKGDEKDSMALSSFIHALYELDSFAIARIVVKDNKEPKMIVLAPNIEPDFECLYDVELPFAEDVRKYRFPPLDRVLTVSGKSLQVHRNLPNDELTAAMSDYVDRMDLSEFDRDEEGQAAEYASPEDTFNPVIHRLQQVIHHRAIFPEAEVPEPRPIISKFSHPPDDLVEKAKPALDAVIKAGEVKKVPPRARGKKWGRKEAPKPLSDLDVAALLAQDPKRKGKSIDPNNAIPEFKQLLDTADSMDAIESACKQLKFIIFDWIRHSVGDSAYGRALEGIRVMREQMNELEHPAPFNNFLLELKQKMLAGELGGDRKEMWYRIRVNKMRPILKTESEGSDFTEEEAKKFMNPNSGA
jgi:ATP-dependent DNA helicase 2 subunit 2